MWCKSKLRSSDHVVLLLMYTITFSSNNITKPNHYWLSGSAVSHNNIIMVKTSIDCYS